MRILALSLVALVDAACLGRPGVHRAAAPTMASARMSADEVVRRVVTVYRNTPRLTARFRLATFNQTFGLPFTLDGTLYFKRPGKVRLDFLSPRDPHKGQLSHSHRFSGNSVWAIDVRGRWYFKRHRSRSEVPPAILFLTDAGTLSTDFRARLRTAGEYGEAGDTVLELTPRTSSARFKRLLLVVDPSTFRVEKSIVTSVAGDTSELSFYAPDTTRRVADSWFVFDPKAAAARGFRQVTPGWLPPVFKPRPAPSPTASGEKAFLSEEWLRAYRDCEDVRRAKPPREHPPSLADMQRCAFPAGETRQQLPSRPVNRP
jgi:outer membrane lipoprotein carrier protein